MGMDYLHKLFRNKKKIPTIFTQKVDNNKSFGVILKKKVKTILLKNQ